MKMNFKRGKRKYIANYKSPELYKYYKENHPNNTVDYKKFIEVTRKYYDLIMPLVIEEGLEIRFPARLGHFRIRQADYKITLTEDGEIDKRYLAPNFKKTKELWEKIYKDIPYEEIKDIKDKPIIYHLNEHSDHKIFQFFWDRLVCNIVNQQYYTIQITRRWKNYLSHYSKYASPTYFN